MKTFVYIWGVLFFRFCRYIFVGLVYWYSFVPVHMLTLFNIFLKYKNRNITVSLKATYSFLFTYLFIFCSCKSCVSLPLQNNQLLPKDITAISKMQHLFSDSRGKNILKKSPFPQFQCCLCKLGTLEGIASTNFFFGETLN